MANLDAPERLAVLRGDVISAEPDAALQAIVDEAAELAGTPLAAINLIMGSIQYFRAYRGLPPELATSRATSRCDSFCQFVVQSESSFTVSHASQDDRVPQVLVGTYGIESYFGVPIQVEGQVVGSLCVFDARPREFPPELEAKFQALAARASKRLDELARTGDSADLERVEARPSLQLAEDLSFQARLLERAMIEVGPLVRVGGAMSTGALSNEEAQRVASVLAEATPMFQLLIDEVRTLRAATVRLHATLEAEDQA